MLKMIPSNNRSKGEKCPYWCCCNDCLVDVCENLKNE